MAGKRLEKSIGELADLFEYGHLMAETLPSQFIDAAAAEIRESRATITRLRGALRGLVEALPDPSAYHIPKPAFPYKFHFVFGGKGSDHHDNTLRNNAGFVVYKSPMKRQCEDEAAYLAAAANACAGDERWAALKLLREPRKDERSRRCACGHVHGDAECAVCGCSHHREPGTQTEPRKDGGR